MPVTADLDFRLAVVSEGAIDRCEREEVDSADHRLLLLVRLQFRAKIQIQKWRDSPRS